VRSTVVLFVLGLLLEGALLGLLTIEDLRRDIYGFWCWVFPAFVLYVGAVLLEKKMKSGWENGETKEWKSGRVEERKRIFPPFFHSSILPFFSHFAFRGGRYTLPLIVSFALLFRLTLFFGEPSLSDDIYRYLWDGKTQNEGINPYRYAPEARELAPLRDAAYKRINHKEIPTIYPPLAQVVFAIACRLRPTVGGMKGVMIGIDVAIIALLILLLREMRRPISSVIVYAWNPMVVVETAGSGHNDGLGVLFLLLAILWLRKRRETLSAVALGCSCLAKFFGGALVPVFVAGIVRQRQEVGDGERIADDRLQNAKCKMRNAKGGRESKMQNAKCKMQNAMLFGKRWIVPVRYILLFIGTLLLGYLPYIGAGERLFTGLGVYASVWESNDLLFSWITGMTGSDGTAKAIVGVGFAGLIAWMTLRKVDPLKAACVAVGAFLLLSPTLHPWYLLWIVPFLCVFTSWTWIVFSGLVLLSYQVLIDYTATGAWELSSWVLWVEYLPLYGGLIWETMTRQRNMDREVRRRGEHSSTLVFKTGG
jgi:hypothetical protein